MNVNCAVLVIADNMSFCGILGTWIIERNLNEGALILLEEK
jgi:hypothetical protein